MAGIKVAFFGGLDADVYKASPATLAALPEHEVNPDKAGVPLWAPVVMAAGARREKANVIEVTAFVVDLDGCTEAQLAATFAALEDLHYWAHTSHGHNPQAGVHKWRFVVPFRTPCPGNRHPAVWRACAERYCPWLDQQCKDSSRVYYIPSCPPDRAAEAVLLHAPGEALDWTVLPLAPPEAANPVLSSAGRLLAPEAEAIVVAAIAPHWPPLGTRHKLALALGGALRRDGLPDDQIARIVEAIYTQNKDETVSARVKTALDSANGVAGGGQAYGWTTIAEIIGAPSADLAREAAAPPPQPGLDIAALGLPAGTTEDPGLAWPDENSNSLAPLALTARGTPISCGANVERILAGHPAWAGVLAYDELGARVMATRPPPVREGGYSPVGAWTDAHTTNTQHWILDRFGWEPVKAQVDDAITAAANRNRYHPVQQYLQGLQWDGVLRLDRFLQEYFGAVDSVYSRAVGRKWLIGAVARAMRPGCKVDTMLILEGAQGKKKSTAFAVLAGDAWFSDSAIDFRSKDAVQTLQGKWIVEIAELDSFRRAQMTTIKAFISSRVDNIRPSYGRRNVDYPRQCVFVGTTNESHYLTDPTGNRRFWPVECGEEVNTKALLKDRDQLWAEAHAAWAKGEEHWLTPEQTAFAREEQEDRQLVDPWEEEIIAWLAANSPAEFQADKIMNHLGIEKAQRTPACTARIGVILKRLGYNSSRVRLKGSYRSKVRVYSYDENLSQQSVSIHGIPGGKVSGVSNQVGAAKVGRDR